MRDVTYTVQDAVDARLADSQPGEVVEDAMRNRSRGAHSEDNSEGEPEDDEEEEAAHVGLHEGVIPSERHRRLNKNSI